eukprot:943601-Rhodomonas_salina.2
MLAFVQHTSNLHSWICATATQLTDSTYPMSEIAAFKTIQSGLAAADDVRNVCNQANERNRGV